MAMLFVAFRGTHPPPCPALSAQTEPISQGHCWEWHHKLKTLCLMVCQPLVV